MMTDVRFAAVHLHLECSLCIYRIRVGLVVSPIDDFGVRKGYMHPSTLETTVWLLAGLPLPRRCQCQICSGFLLNFSRLVMGSIDPRIV